MSDIRVSEVQCAEYSIQIRIEASRKDVWQALFDKINFWWLPEYHMLGTQSIVSFEPRAGGPLLEKDGDRGLTWFTVIAIAPMSSVTSVGHCTGEFGGPSTSLLTLKLSSSDSGTVLIVREEIVGKAAAAQAKSLQAGWKQLFTDGLKRWLETQPSQANS